jgi:quercetin 2,3-dioxygenase
MPAITVDDITVLPRIPEPDPTHARQRPVRSITSAPSGFEGEGFPVRRAFAGVDLADLDPFVHLDQMGEVEYAPGEPKGTPWHPHRGFETVTYLLDGEIAHHDSNGGGGVIGEGDTQWMTAGSGVLHDEVPSDPVLRSGGPAHGVQLWVNLPAALKFSPPRYQAITGDLLTLLTTHDGSALIRLIAGDLAGHAGPGVTHTPITYAHVTLPPGSQLVVPWNPAFNAMAYALLGQGYAGDEEQPFREHELVLFGAGDHVVVRAAERQEGDTPTVELLLLGGLPIREPIAHYGPFVMNNKAEIIQALEDYEAGRMGTVPATTLTA